MKQVQEVSRLTGVSVRTLHHYDAIGLLKPTKITQAGYRLYDGKAISRLQTILLFRELDFSLSDIKMILDAPDFDTKEALRQQIRLFELQKDRLDRLIGLARRQLKEGDTDMDFTAFDKTELDAYEQEAKARWGKSPAYREYESRPKSETASAAEGLMEIFAQFGAIRDTDPASGPAQALAGRLQSYITEHFYTCTPEILAGLGQMYTQDERFRTIIDERGGEGTADFVSRALKVFCKEA